MVKQLENRFDLEFTEENAGSLVNHCALAFQRFRNGEPIDEQFDDLEEIKKQYPKLYSLSRDLVEDFITVHVQNVINLITN
jgi:transcriptional antiterminator